MLIFTISIAAIFAKAAKKDSLSLGLNLGTNNGVMISYGMGAYDIEGIVGFSIFSSALDVEIAMDYMLFDIASSSDFDGSMPLTIGGEVCLSTDFDYFALGGLVPIKLKYVFPKIPMALYFRVAPGVCFKLKPDTDMNFALHASIGCTYNF